MERNRYRDAAPRRPGLDGPRARRSVAGRSPYEVPRGARPSRRTTAAKETAR